MWLARCQASLNLPAANLRRMGLTSAEMALTTPSAKDRIDIPAPEEEEPAEEECAPEAAWAAAFAAAVAEGRETAEPDPPPEEDRRLESDMSSRRSMVHPEQKQFSLQSKSRLLIKTLMKNNT